MKRYRHEPNGGLVPHEKGRYVDAAIAQELYDMLGEISDWDGLPPYYQNKLEETLEKANED